MAARTSVYILIFVMLFTFSCKKKGESYLHDGNFHFVLHTNPSSDCPDCIINALKLLDKYITKNQNLDIYLKKSEDNERFKSFLNESFKERKLSFFEVDLKVPHPSILLVKNKSIYMYLYIPNDSFLFEESLSLCRDFFLNTLNR